MCSKVLNGHIILTDTSITTILAPEMTYTPKIWTIAELSDKSGKSKIIAHDRCSRTLSRKIRAYEPVS